jgi:hypothetical protein
VLISLEVLMVGTARENEGEKKGAGPSRRESDGPAVPDRPVLGEPLSGTSDAVSFGRQRRDPPKSQVEAGSGDGQCTRTGFRAIPGPLSCALCRCRGG